MKKTNIFLGLFFLVLLSGRLFAFAGITHITVKDYFDGELKDFIEKYEWDFAYGTIFPDISWMPGVKSKLNQPEITKNVPKRMLEELSKNLDELLKDFKRIDVGLHNIFFALDLVQNASNERELAFSIGVLAHHCADMVSENHYVSHKLSQFGQEGIDNIKGEAVVELFADLYLAQDAARVMFCKNVLKKRSDVIIKYAYKMMRKELWGTKLSQDEFEKNIAIFEQVMNIGFDLEYLAVRTGLHSVLEGELYNIENYSDIGEFLEIAARATSQFLEKGLDCSFYKNGWCMTNPYSMIAGSLSWMHKLRDPNYTHSNLIIYDSYFETKDGKRCNISGLSEKSFNFVTKITAVKPVKLELLLEIKLEGVNRPNRKLKSHKFSVEWTKEDIFAGLIVELKQDFILDLEIEDLKGENYYEGVFADIYVLTEDNGKVLCFSNYVLKDSRIRNQKELVYYSFPFGLDLLPDDSPAKATTDKINRPSGLNIIASRQFKASKIKGFEYVMPEILQNLFSQRNDSTK